MSERDRKAVAVWLVIVCGLIFVMVVLGGVTRLTESGLSMTEWRPVTGWLPPLDQTAWQGAFDAYKDSPEYRKINFSMGLDDFKTIYWFEYSHRLLGRLIGIAFFVPFVWFLARGRLDASLTAKLAVIFVLGGLQGAVGWFMVASGLVDRPYVSQYRLALHLGLAVLIYALIFLVAVRLVMRPVYGIAENAIDRLRRGSWWLVALIGLTMLAGAFVAGLDAGHAYNTFPLMDGRLVPQAYLDSRPWWINPFENVAAVQFDHRVLAVLTLAAVLVFVFWAQRFNLSRGSSAMIGALAAVVLAQFALGVATLLLFVPVWLGALHQAGALVLLTLALLATQRLRRQLA